MTVEDVSIVPSYQNADTFRAEIKCLLMNSNYQEVEPKVFKEKVWEEKKIFAYKYSIGESIYGLDRKVDFILFHPIKWSDFLVIQCRFQKKSGTVDQKFPYDVKCIRKSEVPTVMVLEGGGWKPEAKRWLENKVPAIKWLLAVVSFAELGEMI